MSNITLGGNLPNDDKYNGLHVIADDLIKDPAKQRLAVIYLDSQKTITKTDDGESTPVLRIRRIEVATDPDDVKELAEVMDRLQERRMGMLPLSPDGEDEQPADQAKAAKK